MSRPTRWQRLRKDQFALLGMGLTLVLYVSSFFLRAYEVHIRGGSNPITLYGWEAFRDVGRVLVTVREQNWEYILVLVWWLPNPMICVGVVLLGIGCSRAAAVFGLIALLATLMCGFEPDRARAFDFRYFREGYYCWMTSMLVLTAVAVIRSLRPSGWDYFEKHRVGGIYLNSPIGIVDEPPPPPTR